MLMPLIGRPMLSTIEPNDSGGMIARMAASILSSSTPVSSMRVPVGARTCSSICVLSTGGKKFWPRYGASANEHGTATRKPTMNTYAAANAVTNRRR